MTILLPFVGRDREVALLRSALDSALGGQGGVALIGGDAGIGKTTLAEFLCDEASSRGALVLTGHCYDLTETAPFAPWIELFSAYPTNDSLPEIPLGIARCEIGGDTGSQAALFTAIHDFLAAVANERPLVLLLDDQHWADDASLDLLRFLARQASTLPLFILVTYRAAELAPTHHLTQLLPLLAREARALRINLQPLASDDLWAIIRPRYQLGVDDEARLTSYLHDRTEGNPFFASELLQTLEEKGVLRQEASEWVLGDLGKAHTPMLVNHMVGGRLAHLSGEDQRLLSVAAVLGQELPLALWSKVAETGHEPLLDVVDRASQARLMTETPDGRGVRFLHALTRQAVYERLAPSRRRLWHQQAGTVLAAVDNPDPDSVADHFRRSGDPRAAEWLIRAGERAERAYSWNEAADRFEAAVAAMHETGDEAETQGWLLVRIARMRRYAAPGVGLLRLEEAGRIAEATGDRPLAAAVIWQVGLLHCLQGTIQHGVRQLERSVAALSALTPAERERIQEFGPIADVKVDAYHGQGTLALWLTVVGRYRDALRYATPYNADTTIPEGMGGTFGDAYVALARCHAMLGDAEESRAAYALARSGYRSIEHSAQIARAIMNELHVRILPFETDNLAERRRLVNEAESAWNRGSGALADEIAGAMRMPLQFIDGKWTEMKATALAFCTDATISMRAEATYWLAPVARAQGDTELAWELVEQWLPAGPATAPGDTVYRTAQRMQRLAAELALDSGDLPAARRWLEARDQWLDWSGAVLGRATSALGWAAYHRAGYDREEARRQAERALQLATTPRQPLTLTAAHRMLGELDTIGGLYDAAADHLETSLNLADACAAPYERGLTLLALAELDLARGDAGNAANRLAAARSIFESLGAKPSLAQADALVAQLEREHSGDRSNASVEPTATIPSIRDSALLTGISPRELDVLRLLPAGHTNQEIADLLFLSPKTVENHIGRILAKTNLPNRAAAAAFAQRLGLD